MEKKIKFTNNPSLAKTVYGVIIAVLCITAIIIGIVAANQRDDTVTPNEPPVTDGTDQTPPDTQNPPSDEGGESKEPEKLTFIAPVSGRVVKNHSTTVPVFSETLEEWRVHTGIDISCAEGAPVFASAAGEVTRIYNDALLGRSVEITHEGGVRTIYSNLAANETLVEVGDKIVQGGRIGTVGDSSISELAEEPHLHFSVIEGDKAIDPMTILSEESKSASLGITAEG